MLDNVSSPTVRSAVMQLVRLVVSAILLPAFAPRAAAQCPVVDFSITRQAPLIFSGTVLNIEPSNVGPTSLVTFKVDAVWKGKAASTITVYQWNMSERIELAIGKRYLIFAGLFLRWTDREPDFVVDDCGSMTYEAANSDTLRALGPSHPPQ